MDSNCQQSNVLPAKDFGASATNGKSNTPVQAFSTSLTHSSNHPAPTETIQKLSQNHPQRIFSQLSIIKHISNLKHARPQAEPLSIQYDNALTQLYLHEWPDAVPKYKNNHRCCCRRDPKRDHDARHILKQVFPPYLYYILVMSGAVPPASMSLFGIVTLIWILWVIYLVCTVAMTIFIIFVHALCWWDPNCITKEENFSFTGLIAMLIGQVSNILFIIMVHTSLRDQLQSRELLTLVFSVGPGRIRKPQRYW